VKGTEGMEWAEVLKDSTLQNLPYKVELNRFGKLVLTPASNKRGMIQSRVGFSIQNRRKDGEIINRCSVNTSDGVKVADVAWASDEFISEFGHKTRYEKAPELCVEIVSPSNSSEELRQKIDLYLAKGATEVWIVTEDGEMKVYNNRGEANRSALVKKFKL
jgi:Uma2 family endonuclease